MSSITEEVKGIAMPLLERKGLELVDLQYRKEGKNWVLRLLIDRWPEGVTIGDCQEVSEELDDELDHAEVIDRSYLLEVASPGIDRPLLNSEDYRRFAGERVKLKTYGPVDGRRTFRGILRGLEDKEVLVELEDQMFHLPLDMIASANLDPDISF